MQFHEIILSRKERKLLTSAAEAPVPCIPNNLPAISRLEDLGFLQSEFVLQVSGKDLSSGEELYSITETGRSFLIYCESGRMKAFWEWFRYGITTAIALAGLVTAIISILMQRS